MAAAVVLFVWCHLFVVLVFLLAAVVPESLTAVLVVLLAAVTLTD